jgi:hypothetical protein
MYPVEGESTIPAPTMTLESPFHNDLNPSTRDIVSTAFDIPVYMALGEGLTNCILVCKYIVSEITPSQHKLQPYL